MVATPQATDAGTDGVTKALQQAGATVTRRVQLTDGYSDPRRAEDAKSYVTGGSQPAGFQLPESDDAGVLSGALLSYALLGDKKATRPATTSEILSGFSTLKMLRVSTRRRSPPATWPLWSAPARSPAPTRRRGWPR